MLVVETIAKIRRAYFAQNKPIKTIWREFRVSRRVVRKVIRSQATEFRCERSQQPRPRIDPWRDQLDGLLLENERAHAAGTGSLLSQRWRKPDLNHRYRAIRPRFRKGSCRLCLLPRPTEEPANESWYHDEAGLALRDRRFESCSLQWRVNRRTVVFDRCCTAGRTSSKPIDPQEQRLQRRLSSTLPSPASIKS
jgi:hypothetical protein